MLGVAFFLVSVVVASLADHDPINKHGVNEIEKKMSREVEDEFSGTANQDELEVLKRQYSSSHAVNQTLISIPTELDVNWNKTNLFEGDIDLTPEQWKVALDIDPVTRSRRQALYSAMEMWQPMGGAIIPYTFERGFPAQYHQVVRDALAFWEQRTCIKFRLVNQYDYDAIVFNHNADGCSSAVGRIGGGQYINLEAPGCMSVTIIAHELSHAFGTLHVQSRVDRDTYVQIDTSNIVPGTEHNFAREPNSFSTYGLPYEFGSMQHYFSFAFAIDPKKPTIYARPNYQRFQGSMDGPRATFWDTVLINKMYKCTDKCLKQMGCWAGGVTDGADCYKCFCPIGYTGTNCEKRPDDAQIMNVSDTPQSVKMELKGAFRAFEEKLVVLQAPAGKRIEATLRTFGPTIRAVNVHCRNAFRMCRGIGLEILPLTDTRTSGIHFCATPNPLTPIYSEANTTLLYLYRDINYPVAVDVTVRSF
ncbi:hypothetical protein PRIPAC_97581 [Pristionchus pacificus]|uniref:Metalloendopeptidase n=1 Tax=Pristionchus pacificus TaxID=54126 RepID=A0A2A6D1V2_PRIPA|nr:hypothetical protein PRIPAC_97581 [Pristionchus pacificus]|eukprot:PDM84462.1 metallopeptidase [Pristionchus pacificus]